MIRFNRLYTLRPLRQRGWVMIEMILCLVLFSVVLHLAQQQNESHWQSIQLAQQAQKQADNELKKRRMVQLTGSTIWLKHDPIPTAPYPNCQHCTDSALKTWFFASLYPASAPDAVAEEEPQP
ncbi:hypothetical protein [Marinomonas sp. IMCC 4694]|uniref:hypothetical protein n=1 Tax=Marinomonas sp. IMCC 4694 TaxID=2605432 RepID=UPI0011E76E19|nr:hypothetical protein [Marinomonas sp. IMCC 4694]TYL47576.1 hypothetical protein FXV75_06200 [Marinomonas sp. IMCC 4694]